MDQAKRKYLYFNLDDSMQKKAYMLLEKCGKTRKLTKFISKLIVNFLKEYDIKSIEDLEQEEILNIISLYLKGELPKHDPVADNVQKILSGILYSIEQGKTEKTDVTESTREKTEIVKETKERSSSGRFGKKKEEPVKQEISKQNDNTSNSLEDDSDGDYDDIMSGLDAFGIK